MRPRLLFWATTFAIKSLELLLSAKRLSTWRTFVQEIWSVVAFRAKVCQFDDAMIKEQNSQGIAIACRWHRWCVGGSDINCHRNNLSSDRLLFVWPESLWWSRFTRSLCSSRKLFGLDKRCHRWCLKEQFIKFNDIPHFRCDKSIFKSTFIIKYLYYSILFFCIVLKKI